MYTSKHTRNLCWNNQAQDTGTCILCFYRSSLRGQFDEQASVVANDTDIKYSVILIRETATTKVFLKNASPFTRHNK